MRIVKRTPFDDWHDALAKGDVPDTPDVVFKQFVPDEIKAIDEEKRQVRFRITTGTPDRMNDTIAPDGWDLRAYKKNAVVMWAHRYDEPPIGRAVKMEKDDNGLIATAQFATKEQYAFADTIYQLILGGFLKATSVGFKPLKHVYNEQRHGVDFIEQSLLEFSVCPIPANAEALIEASAAGIDIDPLRDWAQGILDSAYDEPGVWVPRKQVELMLRILPDAGKTISIPPAKPAPSGPTVILDLGALEPVDVTKPFPNEHACRLNDPGKYSEIRRGTRKHNGKAYGVLYGKPKEGDGGWEEQAYRYSKDVWEADEARAHCKSHEGSFEAASGKTIVTVHLGEDAALAARARELVLAGKSAEALALFIAPKVMPSCPKGEDCPMKPGMKECPAGKQCPMEKGAAPERVRLELDLADEEIVIELDDDADAVDVTAEDLRIALREQLPALITQEINRLRGRID